MLLRAVPSLFMLNLIDYKGNSVREEIAPSLYDVSYDITTLNALVFKKGFSSRHD